MKVIRSLDRDPMIDPELGKTLDELEQREQRFHELISKRIELSKRTEIANMAAYALEWDALVAAFAELGMKANAELCASRAGYYGALAARWPGAYQRSEVAGQTLLSRQGGNDESTEHHASEA